MTEHPTGRAGDIYEAVRSLPIVSPHGHCDPAWFAEDRPFADPAALLVIPDHYVFRMLYSQGVPLEALEVGAAPGGYDPRAVFRTFAAHWHLFLGTPSRTWMRHVLEDTIGCDTPLAPETSDAVYDHVAAWLAEPAHRPRALFDRFGIEVLATTDAATDSLEAHAAIAQSGWQGRVVPTFRPDSLLDPAQEGWVAELETLGQMTGEDTDSYDGYLAALRARRAAFRAAGATATDHAIEEPRTCWLENPSAVYAELRSGDMREAATFHGHMLIEMAQMSCEDGLVMQLHAGSRRNTNPSVFARFGRDKGADILLIANEFLHRLPSS